MSRIFANWIVLAQVWLVVAACTTVLALIVARWRRRRGAPAPWRDTVAEAAIFIGTVPWLVLMFWPRRMATTYQLVPFVDLFHQLSGDPVSAFIQIVANVVVFAPLGFFGPIRFVWLRSVPRVAMLGFGASAVVEVLQYALHLGRVASIDDVLLNGAGAVLAAVASRPWWGAESNAIQQVRTPSSRRGVRTGR
jgi:VanZ family protein